MRTLRESHNSWIMDWHYSLSLVHSLWVWIIVVKSKGFIVKLQFAKLGRVNCSIFIRPCCRTDLTDAYISYLTLLNLKKNIFDNL